MAAFAATQKCFKFSIQKVRKESTKEGVGRISRSLIWWKISLLPEEAFWYKSTIFLWETLMFKGHRERAISFFFSLNGADIHFQTLPGAPIWCTLKALSYEVLLFAQVFVKFPTLVELCYFYPLSYKLLNLEVEYRYNDCTLDKGCKLSVSHFSVNLAGKNFDKLF